ncbi:fibronectin type III domain-containing protein, partial [Larkinella soli]|uniref:fibronectin type III domain-containing protein n=1 Tax=Larkinella soli TaxID=1770527 RepID=UPI0013E3AA5E
RDRQPVSNAGTALMTVLLHYPPLLTFPAPGQTLPHQPQPAVLFQWTPRNAGTVAFTGLPLYTFRLWELRDAGQDANAVALSQPPLYEETTAQPSLWYGPTLPPLQAGMRYGWQVQAFDEKGQDLYVNQGLSQVATFTAGLPLADSMAAPSPTRVDWAAIFNPESCPVNTVSPSPADSTQSPADLLRSPALTRLLTDSTRLPRCPGSEVSGYNCQETVALPPPTGEPQGRLQPGEVLMIDQYKVLLTQVSGGAGRFSGQGLLPWNFAGGAFVPVAFEDLQVVKAANTTGGGCVTGGRMTSAKADAGLSGRLQTLLAKPTAFEGTLGEALDSLRGAAQGTDDPATSRYLTAVQEGLGCWQQRLQTARTGVDSLKIRQALSSLDSLLRDLGTAQTCLTAGCVPDRTLLTEGTPDRIDQILEVLETSLLTDPLPKPEQLAFQPLDSAGVRISWAPHARHLSYRLTYRDARGREHTLLPTRPQAILNGIEPNQPYNYTITAYGDGFTVSPPAQSEFHLGTRCEVTLTASAARIAAGQEVTLAVIGCRSEQGQAGTLLWSENGRPLGTFTQRSFQPQTTTTYSVTCLLGTDTGGQPIGCVDQRTVTVEPVCAGVVARDCRLFQLAAKSIGAERRRDTQTLVEAVGCTGTVQWEKLRGNANLRLDVRNDHVVNVTNIRYSFQLAVTCPTTGCRVIGDYPAPPNGSGLSNAPTPYCSYQQVKLVLTKESSQWITLALANPTHQSIGTFRWDDQPLATEPLRTFLRLRTPAVFQATYQNGKCKVAYIYDPKASDSLEIPCPKFELNPKEQVVQIPYNRPSQDLTLTATGCTNGVQLAPVTWNLIEGGRITGLRTDTTGKYTYPFTDAQANQSLQFQAVCSLFPTHPQLATVRVEKALPPDYERAPADPCSFFVSCPDPANFYLMTAQALQPMSFTVSGGSHITAYPQNGGPALVSTRPDGAGNVVCQLATATVPGSYSYRIVNKQDDGQFCVGYLTLTVDYQRAPLVTGVPNQPTYAKPKQASNRCGTLYQLAGRSGTFGIPHNAPQHAWDYVFNKNAHPGLGVFAAGYTPGSDQTYGLFRDPDQIGLVDKVCARTPGATLKVYNSREVKTKQTEVGALAVSPMQHVAVTFKALDGIKQYFGRCTFPDGTYCDSEFTIDPGQVGSGGGSALADATPAEAPADAVGDGGAGAGDGTASQPCVYARQEAVRFLLDEVLCRRLSAVAGSKKPQLEALRAGLAEQGLTLPPVTDAMAADLDSGRCAQVVQALTAGLSGNAPVDSLKRLVNPQTAEELVSRVLEETEDEVIDSDLVERAIEDFGGSSGARLSTFGLCPAYYFSPAGNRITVPDIQGCVVSVNGILLKFERAGKSYVALFKRKDKIFIGYHDEARFLAVAKAAADGKVKIAARSQLNTWVSDLGYQSEKTGIERFKEFINSNRTAPGLLRNYSPAIYEQILVSLKDWPEESFRNVEAEDSPFRFDLSKILEMVSSYLIKDRILISGTKPSYTPTDSCGNRNNSALYEMCFADNPPLSWLDECAKYYYDQYSKAPIDARKDFASPFRSKGLDFVPDYFLSGSGGILDLTQDYRIVESLNESASFNNFHQALSENIINIIHQDSLTKIDESLLTQGGRNINFTEWEVKPVIPTNLYLCMGGTKYLEIKINLKKVSTTNEFFLTLHYEIWDTFGADRDDIQCEELISDASLWPPRVKVNLKSVILPLKAFFLLQHYNNIGGNCRPFITKLKVTKIIKFK